MSFLLDVNVLIALIDPAHVHREAAHRWFAAEGKASFATCPITENGVLRIVGHPRYPGTTGSPAAAMPALVGLHGLPGHAFWEDSLSLVSETRIDASRLTASSQITDTYLLALASARGGRLATFDRRLVTAAVDGGEAALQLIT